MAFEIQQLLDVIKIIVLLELNKGKILTTAALKRRIDNVCASIGWIDEKKLEEALTEMDAEGLILFDGNLAQLTAQGLALGKEWESLMLKKEPILEVVAGLVDGSITSLVVILSAFLSTFTGNPVFSTIKSLVFAAFLTLSAVAITNFSSFLLGGITEDLSDMVTLQTLMNYSLSDITDAKERNASLLLVKNLFTVLGKEIHRSNLFAASICGTTTFLAGSIPIITYVLLPAPLNIALSLTLVVVISGVFLVRYRARKTRVHWKVTLLETLAIVIIAATASLLLGLA